MVAQAARNHPDRFRALLAMPLQFPELAVQELDRFTGQPEVVGVILAGSAGGRQLNDPAFMPFYAELEHRGLPFLLHPISPPGLDCMLELNLANVVGFMFETTLAAVRLVYAGVFERYPRLQMIFPHLGGLAPYLMGRLQWGYERFPVCIEKISAPPEAISSASTTTLSVGTCRPSAWPSRCLGRNRSCSVPTFPCGKTSNLQRGDIEALGLTDTELDDIYSGNAARLLGISLSG